MQNVNSSHLYRVLLQFVTGLFKKTAYINTALNKYRNAPCKHEINAIMLPDVKLKVMRTVGINVYLHLMWEIY